MNCPRVSIILPTYNGETYIRQTIESCLAQTYAAIELIVVDDGSTDSTPAIVAGYNDPRVRLIRHAVNKRLPAALNTGCAAATGAYLTWISDDNYFAPHAIEVMASCLRTRRGVDFVYAGYTIVDEHDEPARSVAALPPRELFHGNCVGACFLYRRAVYEATGAFDESLFLVEDYDYWFRVRRRFTMKNLPAPLCFVRRHPGSLTATHPEEHARRRKVVMEKYWARWERHCYHALVALENGHAARACQLSMASIAAWPFQRYGVTTLARSIHRMLTGAREAPHP